MCIRDRRIADRLAQRPEIELLSISAEGRKDVNERAKVINSADLAFLWWQANLQICRNIAHYYLYPIAHRLQQGNR